MKIDYHNKPETNYRARTVAIQVTAFVGTQEVEFYHEIKNTDHPLEMSGKEFVDALRFVHDIPEVIHVRLNSITFIKT